MLDGIPFDVEAHRQQMEAWQQELEPLQEKLHALLGDINLDSGTQLGEWLRQNLESSVLNPSDYPQLSQLG